MVAHLSACTLDNSPNALEKIVLFTCMRTRVSARVVNAIAVLVFLGLPFSPVARPQPQDTPGSQPTAASAGSPQQPPQQDQQQPGTITGKVVDQSGTDIVGAVVKLTRDGSTTPLEITSDEDGRFFFSNIAPGDFTLSISFPELASQDFSGTLHSGEHYVTPLMMLAIPTQVTEIHVSPPTEEQATQQIKEQEKQRVLGIVPNFYVSYVENAAPLKPRHKFELAWKSATDRVTLVGVGVLAGIDQAGNRWSSYGQGTQGYAKRLGATYVNVFSSTFIGGAVMPSLLRQDPRYFYKGTGSKGSRLFRAISSSVICKGDNGRWQPNYSNVIGSFAGAGLQYAYIPASDRRGSTFLLSSALIRLGETSLAGILQEFVFPRLSHRRIAMTSPDPKP